MANSNSPHEEDFSLGAYLRVLVSGWRIIAITLVVTILAGVLFSVLQPRTYESEAVLAAQTQKYIWRLDTNFQTITEDLKLDRRGDYTALITDRTLGTGLAKTVIEALGEELPQELRLPSTLRETVDVRNGSGRLVYLTATASDPGIAQKLAATWSEAWIDATNNQFGQGADEAKFAAELAQAEAELQAANDDLETFQSRTGLGLEMGGNLASLEGGSLAAGMPLLQQQLVLNNSSLADYRIALARVRMLADEVNKAKTGATSLAALPLEILETSLLVERGQLTRAKVDAMDGDLDNLSAALAVEESSLAATVSRLEGETESIQTEYASLLQQQQALARRQDLAEEAVKALNRKLTEIPIQQEVTGPPLVVMSPAVLPSSPATPNWMLNMAAAILLGLLGGVVIVFGLEYLRPSA